MTKIVGSVQANRNTGIPMSSCSVGTNVTDTSAPTHGVAIYKDGHHAGAFCEFDVSDDEREIVIGPTLHLLGDGVCIDGAIPAGFKPVGLREAVRTVRTGVVENEPAVRAL